MAKGVKTGGRKKGVPNKATIARQAAVAESGVTPLDFMLATMRNEKLDHALRHDAAKSAAPYVHPKLAAIEHTGKGGAPLIPNQKMDLVEVSKRVAFILARAALEQTP